MTRDSSYDDRALVRAVVNGNSLPAIAAASGLPQEEVVRRFRMILSRLAAPTSDGPPDGTRGRGCPRSCS